MCQPALALPTSVLPFADRDLKVANFKLNARGLLKVQKLRPSQVILLVLSLNFLSFPYLRSFWGPGQPGLLLDMEVGGPACSREVGAS